MNQCFIGIGLAVVTLILYLPVLNHSFIEYDDQQYVTDNPRVQAGLTWDGLIWAFGFHAGNWHPLAWLSHMLDCQLYGANAWGHHLTSVLLHVASTWLLYILLNRMTGALWRSAAVAALFAWHPLHVESVAWVAERKDVLCAFFWMLTLLLYARYAASPSRLHYFFALGAFGLCLMAKPMAVTLPFMMLLLDYWPLQRVSGSKWPVTENLRLLNPSSQFAKQSWGRLILEKLPFFALSAIGCILTIKAQELAIVSTAGLPVVQRAVHALVAYDHYLGVMLIPRNLAVYYPYQINPSAAAIICAIVVCGSITALAIKNFQQRPYLIVGWLWYIGTLVPVIGLVQVGDQAWADRYTYLPLIGPFLAAVWFLFELINHRLILQMLAVLVGVVLLATTTAQLAYWKNTRTLFEHANQVTEENYMAVTVLGSLLAKEHKLNEAMQYYQTALRYKPGFPEAHFFLGNAFDEQGKLDDAIVEYQQALWFRPTQEQTHIFMGMALAKQKKYDEAISHYKLALQLNPDSAVTHNNLARIYHTQGRLDLAIQHYNAALAIDPKLALAHNNLGILEIQMGNLTEGIKQLHEALRLKPENPETELNLALALNQQERWSEASGFFIASIANHPNDPNAHYQYAVALMHLHKTHEAMSELAAALLLRPDFPDALDNLAWILSTEQNPIFRNGPEAVKMAESACALTGRQDPVKLKTLAAAYAESGRFEEAKHLLQTVKELAAKSNRISLVNECAAMLECFKKSEPWRGS